LASSAVTAGKIAAGAVGTTELADSCITTAKIVDGAVTTGKIADGAVTNIKIASGIAPEKIGSGNLNIGTGTITCGQINVGDIVLKYGWVIREYEDRIEIIKDGKVVYRISADG